MNYINQRIKAFKHAIDGIVFFFKNETHAKIHLLAFISVMVLSFYFAIKSSEWLAILLVSALVICLEMLNSAIENLTDLASPEINPLAKKAKDLAAGSVLFSSCIAIIIGLIIFIPKFLEL